MMIGEQHRTAEALVPPGIPAPFDTYLRMRNGFVARKLAEFYTRFQGTDESVEVSAGGELAIAHSEQMRRSLLVIAGEMIGRRVQPVLASPLLQDEVNSRHCEIAINSTDIFGGLLRDPRILDKGILYPRVDNDEEGGGGDLYASFKGDIAHLVGQVQLLARVH